MAHIVFHLTDADLFDDFMRSLPRQVPLEVARKNSEFRNKHFRGYRFTKNSPDFSTLHQAFYEEINQEADEGISNFLCYKWVVGHFALAQTGFRALGIDGFDLSKIGTWLSPAHEALKTRGHIEGARSVVRAVGITHRLEDVLIFVSILSVDYEDQRGLRSAVEEEFSTVQDDSRLSLTHLEEEQRALQERQSALNEKHTLESQNLGNERLELAGRLKESEEEIGTLESEIEKASQLLAEVERELNEVESRRASHRGASEQLEKRKRKVANLRSRVNEDLTKVDAKLADIAARPDEQERAIGSNLEQVRHQIEEVQERLKETQPVPEAHRGDRLPSGTNQDAVSAKTSEPGEWPPSLEELSIMVSQPGFISTPVSLTVARLRATHSVDDTLLNQKPAAIPAGMSDAAAPFWAHRAVTEVPLWNREYLARYAIASTLDSGDHDIEVSTDVLLGGLYHAARVENPELTDLLVRRLVEIVAGVSPSENSDVNENDEAFHIIEQHGSDQETLRHFGCVQAKLAAANPRALRRLYELFKPRGRMVAKRALASHAPQLQVQETDPTHELLDVVSNQIGSLLGPLSTTLRVWRDRARLHEHVHHDRRLLLAAAAKLMHLFSMETSARLTRFHDLLGPRLSETLTENTPDSYNRLSQFALGFCTRECEEPEWISSRFLFPLVFEVARSASHADLQIRRQLKAMLTVSFEKQQHPIGNVRTGIPIRTLISNGGTAAAIDLEVLLVTPQGSPTTIQNQEASIQNCRARETVTHEISLDVAAPLPALEFECLTTWRDPSSSEVQSAVHKLKIVAQREVDWDKARVNPYSLRSITDLDRLVGREDALDALRLGIMGTH